MIAWFSSLEPVIQALFGGLFTWGLTALGAAAVFFFKEVNRKVMDLMVGFTGGVMIAASFWSLLAPAIEMSEAMGSSPWIAPAIGFMMGGGVLFALDKILPHLHIGYPKDAAEGMETTWHRTTLTVMAITLHNAPEGLAVGVAFGALGADIPSASLAGAIALTMGIGIQNFPEGHAFKTDRSFAAKEFLVWTAFCYSRTNCGCYRSSHCFDSPGYFALCLGFRCRCHDICCCGRGDSRIPIRRQYGFSNHWCHGGFYHHDGP